VEKIAAKQLIVTAKYAEKVTAKHSEKVTAKHT
jgi:hypothetical protein